MKSKEEDQEKIHYKYFYEGAGVKPNPKYKIRIIYSNKSYKDCYYNDIKIDWKSDIKPIKYYYLEKPERRVNKEFILLSEIKFF